MYAVMAGVAVMYASMAEVAVMYASMAEVADVDFGCWPELFPTDAASGARTLHVQPNRKKKGWHSTLDR
jgi:hypothetical protein